MAENYSYIYGAFDGIRGADLMPLDVAAQLNREKGRSYLGVGVLSSDVIEGGSINSIEDRMKIVEALRGVDFTFEVGEEELADRAKLSKKAADAYKRFLQRPQEQEDANKDFEYIYLPGTWDLFHAGHLENLELASRMGKKLVVGVKSDELVKEHKNRHPFIPLEERMAILRHIKGVEQVVPSHSRNPQIAIDTIYADYGIKIDAVCVGSDLREDFEAMRSKISPEVRIVFTERPKDGPSTTKILKKIGGFTSVQSDTAFHKDSGRPPEGLDVEF